MNNLWIILLFTIFTYSCNRNSPTSDRGEYRALTEEISARLKPQALPLPEAVKSGKVFPRSLSPSGSVRYVGKSDWTSGFYPGILWLMFELTGQQEFKNSATYYTGLLESEKTNNRNHDLGFKMMSSFGQGYRLTNDTHYREVLIQSARTLITRFSEKTGCIRSWDHHQDRWEFPVIIDNLMNLELLFRAWKETGEPVFYNIAVKHADTTLKNHFRNDFSTYHVVGYDPDTGQVTAKNTHQGYADSSCWARGQAWALYGYTMLFRETQNPVYLSQAEKIAEYLISQPRIRKGELPYWDFSVPESSQEPFDASAAAIISSALFELGQYSQHKVVYFQVAEKLLDTLSAVMLSSSGQNNHGFLLDHSTGSKPQGTEIDVPIIYADYYYLEAMLRKIKSDKIQAIN